MRSRPLALLAVAAALLVPFVARGQAVEGVVRSPDYERPVAGARVVLVDDSVATRDSTTTDEGGRFRVSAAEPGAYVVVVRLEGHLSISEPVALTQGSVTALEVEMPVIATSASRIMGEAIAREERFQVPLEELCQEPLRPWEAGVLVGVTRELPDMTPRPGILLTLEPLDGEDAPIRTRPSSESGAFWFCNVPAGDVRLIARGRGLVADTSIATVRAGTVSWYDALLRRPRTP